MMSAVNRQPRAGDALAGPLICTIGDLILDVHGGNSGPGELADRAGNAESVAPAGVDVDQQRQRHRGRDAASVDQDVVEARHAQVGQTVGGVGHAGARKIERAKTGPLGQQGGIGVDRAGNLQGLLGGDRGAKPGPGGRGRTHLATLGRNPAPVQNGREPLRQNRRN